MFTSRFLLIYTKFGFTSLVLLSAEGKVNHKNALSLPFKINNLSPLGPIAKGM